MPGIGEIIAIGALEAFLYWQQWQLLQQKQAAGVPVTRADLDALKAARQKELDAFDAEAARILAANENKESPK